jgi:hypothetical protein
MICSFVSIEVPRASHRLSWIPRSSDAQDVSPAVERKDALLAEIASHWHEITAHTIDMKLARQPSGRSNEQPEKSEREGEQHGGHGRGYLARPAAGGPTPSGFTSGQIGAKIGA